MLWELLRDIIQVLCFSQLCWDSWLSCCCSYSRSWLFPFTVLLMLLPVILSPSLFLLLVHVISTLSFIFVGAVPAVTVLELVVAAGHVALDPNYVADTAFLFLVADYAVVFVDVLLGAAAVGDPLLAVPAAGGVILLVLAVGFLVLALVGVVLHYHDHEHPKSLAGNLHWLPPLLLLAPHAAVVPSYWVLLLVADVHSNIPGDARHFAFVRVVYSLAGVVPIVLALVEPLAALFDPRTRHGYLVQVLLLHYFVADTLPLADAAQDFPCYFH